MKLNIKNMVCPRCIIVVKQIFDQLSVSFDYVRLGEVALSDTLSTDQLEALDVLLKQSGFERIDDKKTQLLERIKTLVIDTIHHQDHFNLNLNWSSYLAGELNYDYQYLSALFSSISGITLEQYIIKQKTEKAKEYLIYDQLSIKEIAFKLGYSSAAHLSAQFKKVTGMTPSAFKQIRGVDVRQSLDNIL